MGTESVVQALRDANKEKQRLIDQLVNDVVTLEEALRVVNTMFDTYKDMNSHFKGGYKT